MLEIGKLCMAIDEKTGGGGKQQPYDTNNGEYVRNPKCVADEKNLVYQKLFGLETNIPIAHPTFGVHDEAYCDFYIRYCLNLKYPNIPEEKITQYLLKHKDYDDKSEFFKGLGYTIDNWNDLYDQIEKNTSFKRKIFSKFDNLRLTFNTETKIFNQYKGCYYSCISTWAVQPDNTVKLVTIIPKGV